MEEKRVWIVGIHYSDEDSTELYRVNGTTNQVKQYLVALVKRDRKKCEPDWDWGTEVANDVERTIYGPVDELYAVGCYDGYHIDYTAIPEKNPIAL